MTSAIPQGASRDIAAGIAVSLILFALAVNFPVFGFILALFIPLPVLFYRVKWGRRAGTWIFFVTAVGIVAALGRVSLDALFYLELLVLGFSLGETFFMNLSLERTILYAVAAVLGTAGGAGLLYSILTQTGIGTLVSDYILQSLKLTLVLYEKMGVSQDAIQWISNSLEQIHYVLVRILPSLVVSATLFAAWANLLMARSALLSKGLFFPDFGPLNLWKVPEILVWAAIGCGIFLLFPSKAVKVIGLNGLIVLMLIYFLEGLGIISFFFEKKRFPQFLRVCLYLFIFVQQILCLLVAGLGFFDTWIDFRKIGGRPGKNGN